MSETINKVLYNVDQRDDTTEDQKAQARANIGAAAASAVGLASVYHDSNMTGSGTSAEPLGLSSQVRFSNSTSATNVGPGALSATSHVATTWMGPGAFEVSNRVGSQTARLVGGSLTFTDSATSERVNISSIQKWNSYTQITDGGDRYTPVYISGGSALPVDTARYVGIRIDGMLANSWTASAVDMIVPLGNMQGQPAGTEPCYVKYAGKLVTPYGVKLSLCCSGETLSTPTSVVSAFIDNAYIPAGGGYFNLNGITLGRGNNCNTKTTWVSAHFDENPLNSPIEIQDNIGWYMYIPDPVGLAPSI